MYVFGSVTSLRIKISPFTTILTFMSMCAAFPSALVYHVCASSTPPVLQQAASAFSSGAPVAKLTLTGTAISYTGGLTDTGTVVMTAQGDGSGSLSLAMSTAGSSGEVFAPAGTARTCQWMDNNGVGHDMESGSCAVPLAWFMPSLTLQPSTTYATVVDQGIGSIGSSQLRLLAVSPSSTGATSSSASPAGVGAVQVGLDPTTLLPSLIEYVIHPDASPMSTVTVDVSFANYVLQNGVKIPQSIQRRINGALDLDIVIQSSSSN